MATDIKPPALTALNMPVRSVTLTSAGYYLDNLGVALSATDDVSGLSSFAITFKNPSGTKQYHVVGGPSYGGKLISGTSLSGTWPQHVTQSKGEYFLDQYAELGTYTLSHINLTDVAGNTSSYFAADLKAISLDASSFSFNVAAGLSPSYSLAASTGSVNEGSIATFTLTATNVASGTAVAYTLSGISAADVSGGSLSGNAVVNSSGVATISVTLLNDSLTEGSETLIVTAGGATASTVVNDISKAPTYSIYAVSSSLNEGSRAEFYFSASNVSQYTTLPWTLSGISASDVSDGKLSGTLQFSESISSISLFVPLANDELTEGDETLTFSIGGTTASLIIKDTSKSAVLPSYSLTASDTSVNEGSSANFTLRTTNVSYGTSVAYTLSGISAADVSGGSLSGMAVVNSSGAATISVTLLNDSLTEGSETLTVSAGGVSASTVVSDTSLNSFTPNSNIPAKISLGTIAGKTLNLLNPIQFENGRIYYFLDANGDGKNSHVLGNISTYYLDALSHDYLDTLLNNGADTVDTQPNGAKWGVDDERTLKLGSIYIVLPTSSEVKVDFSLDSYFWSGGTRYSTSDTVIVSNGTQSIWTSIGWEAANSFWLATPSIYGHQYSRLSGGGNSASNSIAGVDEGVRFFV